MMSKCIRHTKVNIRMLDRYLIPETLISLAYRSIIVKMFIAFFFLDVNLKKSLMNEVTQARKKKGYFIHHRVFMFP